jgi:5-methyltetrahydropteroyltriglutamate--homocysteine methyltransferase
MKRSSSRILTTHVGSIARPSDLFAAIAAKETGKGYDKAAFGMSVKHAVREVVRQQAECGIDIVNDGEQSKPSFNGYVMERLEGFESRPAPSGGVPWAGSRERASFPEFYDWVEESSSIGRVSLPQWVCTGPVKYRGVDAVGTDLGNLKAALEGVKIEEAFIPAIASTYIGSSRKNEYYHTEEEYQTALADAMREEYKAIVDAGFLVQIDDPRLVTYYALNPDASIQDCRKWAEKRVEMINYATRGIAQDRIRFHTCYSIDIGPRVHDMELKDIVDIVLKVRAGAYSFEASNPRHEHEWRVWKDAKVPDGTLLIPGVITHTTNLVEHPDLVSERIQRFAEVVGRENVIAGADCGFAAGARTNQLIHPTVVWAKFQALAEGARRASRVLWHGH